MQPFGLSLQHRVGLHAAALGLLLSVAFASAAWFVAEEYEHRIVQVVLEAEAQGVQADVVAGLPPKLPASPRLRGWLSDADHSPADLPVDWRRLADGVYESADTGQEGLHLGVFSLIDGRKLVYAVDLNAIEVLEHYLIGISVLIVVVGGAVSALVGQFLARRSLSPVRRLADCVDALPVQAVPSNLADSMPLDALHRVASAIDHYQSRLCDAAEYERAFYADASHELRTPVASLRGAIDVLQDSPDLSASMSRKLDRVDRATTEIAQLLEALLFAARGQPQLNQTSYPDDLLTRSCSGLQGRAASRQVQLRRLADENPKLVRGPDQWLLCLLDNVLRVLVDRPGVRALSGRVSGLQIEIRIDAETDLIPGPSDLGFPLRLVERLAATIGAEVWVQPKAVIIKLSAPSD